MSSQVPPAFPPSNQAPLPPAKKSNLLLWIIGIVVVVMVGFTAMCGLGGYFLMRKAKQSGFDSALITKNPGYATAKMMVTMNPELDVVSSDDSSGAMRFSSSRCTIASVPSSPDPFASRAVRKARHTW